MWKALSELKGYEFSYLCTHDTLYKDLAKLKQAGMVDLVLQFCDEVLLLLFCFVSPSAPRPRPPHY